MKYFLFLYAVIFSFNIHAQNGATLKLSTTLNETRMGTWVQKDYTVWIDMNELEKYCQQEIGSFEYTLKHYQYADSGQGARFYNDSKKRFEVALEQLKNAPHGFDLQKLKLYRGPNSPQKDTLLSDVLESRVKSMLFSGNAVVYYKGKRIDALQYVSKTIGDNPLNHGTCTDFYYDNPKNIIYSDCVIYGW